MHSFINTLDMITKNCHFELEVCRETPNWEDFIHKFKVSFYFDDEVPSIDTTLQVIKDNIFTLEELIELVPICSVHRTSTKVREVLECYNFIGED
jgi:hypothetical protein